MTFKRFPWALHRSGFMQHPVSLPCTRAFLLHKSVAQCPQRFSALPEYRQTGKPQFSSTDRRVPFPVRRVALCASDAPTYAHGAGALYTPYSGDLHQILRGPAPDILRGPAPDSGSGTARRGAEVPPPAPDRSGRNRVRSDCRLYRKRCQFPPRIAPEPLLEGAGFGCPGIVRGSGVFVFRMRVEREGRARKLGLDQRRETGMPFARPSEERRTRRCRSPKP